MSPGTAAGRVALFAFAFGYMSLGILLPLELRKALADTHPIGKPPVGRPAPRRQTSR